MSLLAWIGYMGGAAAMAGVVMLIGMAAAAMHEDRRPLPRGYQEQLARDLAIGAVGLMGLALLVLGALIVVGVRVAS